MVHPTFINKISNSRTPNAADSVRLEKENIYYKSIVLFLYFLRNTAKWVGASICEKEIFVQFLFRSTVIE